MAALHRIANLPDPRLRFAPFGRLQPKACPAGPLLRRAVAIGPIGLRPRQATRIKSGTGPLRPGAAPPRLAARLPFDSPRWRWPRSRRPPTAWLGRRTLNARPSHICPDPPGWGPSARPFFCRLLGAVQQDLIPVDPLQGFVALGQLLPGPAKGLVVQPHLEPALDRLVRGKPLGQHPPPNPCHQDIEHGMQTLPVVVGRTPVPTPDHWRENRRKERPHLIGHLRAKSVSCMTAPPGGSNQTGPL